MTNEKKYFIPSSIEEAMAVASQHSRSFKYVAGGTDVMVNRFQGNDNSLCLIDITKIFELKGVSKVSDFLKIGALEKLDELKIYPEIATEFPMLLEAAKAVGSPLIRKAATLGGNLLCENRCLYYNQSDWWREAVGYCLKCEGDTCIATGGKNACFSELVSDTAPALIAMDAEVEFIDEGVTHRIKVEEIYSGDGVFPRNIVDTMLLTAIYLPLNRNFRASFHKLRERESLDFTSLTSAVAVDNAGKLKIALSGVDPKAVVVVGTIYSDKNSLILQTVKKSRAIDNDMFSRKYRREMIPVFLNRSFKEVGLE